MDFFAGNPKKNAFTKDLKAVGSALVDSVLLILIL